MSSPLQKRPQTEGPRFIKVHRIVVEQIPVAWARHMGGKTTVPFTPKKQRQARDNFLNAIISTRPRSFVEGPIGLEITAFLPIPKSWPKYRKREAIETIIRPTSTPDWDNYGKFISDALEGVFYKNDSAIVGAGVSLFYSDRPRWEITLYKWGL